VYLPRKRGGSGQKSGDIKKRRVRKHEWRWQKFGGVKKESVLIKSSDRKKTRGETAKGLKRKKEDQAVRKMMERLYKKKKLLGKWGKGGEKGAEGVRCRGPRDTNKPFR